MTITEIADKIRRRSGYTKKHSLTVAYKWTDAVPRSLLGRRSLAYGGSAIEYPHPEENLLASFIAANPPPKKRKRTVSQESIEKTRITKLYRKLTPAIQAACWEDTEQECPDCDGYGLVFVCRGRHDDGREVKCRKCGGEGSVWHRRRCAAAVEASSKCDGSEADKITAAKACCNVRDEWDGTLTSTWQRNGFIDETESERIREKCRERHEETDYDSLLASGVPKEDAREMIRA